MVSSIVVIYYFFKIKAGNYVVCVAIVTWYPTETMEVGWLLFELTVTWLGWHLVALTKSPEQGGGGRSQMIGWGPKTEVAPFSPSAKKTRRNVSYWKGLVADRPIAIYSGWRQKNYLRTRGTQVLQASIKNSIKSINPWKKKDSPVEPRRKIR